MINNDISFLKNRILKYLVAVSCILVIFNSFIFSPLYVVTVNDTIYINTIMPDIFRLLIEALDIFAYTVSLPLIAFSCIVFSFRGTITPIIIYVASLFIRKGADIIMTLLISKQIDALDLYSSLLYIFIDIIILCITLSATLISAKSFRSSFVERKKTASRLGKAASYSEFNEILPLKSVFSRKNPLLVSAFTAACVLVGTKSISRAIYYFTVGTPSSTSAILAMVLSFLSDILIGVIFYTGAHFIFGHIFKLLEKMQEND